MGYENLLESISYYIRQNGVNAITGQVMQTVLKNIVSTIGAYPTFGGVATPSTNPNNIDQNIFYLTSTPGTYANFGGIQIQQGRLAALVRESDGWTQKVIMTLQGGGVINIDPALDPNSVNPVENRVITRVCTELDNRITTLENASGAKLYQKDLYFRVETANRKGLFTISFLSTNNHHITSISQLAGESFFIKQSKYLSEDVDMPVATYIRFLPDGGAKIEEMMFTDPYYSTWNIASNDNISIISGRVIDIIV